MTPGIVSRDDQQGRLCPESESSQDGKLGPRGRVARVSSGGSEARELTK